MKSCLHFTQPVNGIQLEVLPVMPVALCHLSVGVDQCAASMELSFIELALVDLAVEPFEDASPMHISIFEGPLVLACLSPHFSMANF